MKRESILNLARPVVVTAGFALFLDLFLDWREVFVRAGAVNIELGDSAWSNGWGLAAGMAVSALVVLELPLFAAGHPAAAQSRNALAAGLGVAVLALTLAAFADTSLEVTTSATLIEVGPRLWPAYAGLVLATTIALATLVQLASSARESTKWGPGRNVAPRTH